LGKRHGRGIEYNENGIVEYDGEWADDKWSGFGTQYDENGDILRRGFWKDGKL
jgi:antitoxin component YwqK of YwqJK toxin-antitoxin module